MNIKEGAHMEDVVLTRTWFGDMIDGKPGYLGKTLNNNVTIMVVNTNDELLNVQLESPQYKEHKVYWGNEFDVMQWIADECNVRLHIEGELYFPLGENEDMNSEELEIEEEE